MVRGPGVAKVKGRIVHGVLAGLGAKLHMARGDRPKITAEGCKNRLMHTRSREVKEATGMVASSSMLPLLPGKGWVFLPDPVGDRLRVESTLFSYGETWNHSLIRETASCGREAIFDRGLQFSSAHHYSHTCRGTIAGTGAEK